MPSRDAAANARPGRHGLVAGTGPVKLWGLPPEERFRRAFLRADLTAAEAPAAPDDRAAVFRADVVFDEVAGPRHGQAPGTKLTLDGEPVAANVAARRQPTPPRRRCWPGRGPRARRARYDAVRLVGTYDGELETRLLPGCGFRPRPCPAIETRMFEAYRVTDLGSPHTTEQRAGGAPRRDLRHRRPALSSGPSPPSCCSATGCSAGGSWPPR